MHVCTRGWTLRTRVPYLPRHARRTVTLQDALAHALQCAAALRCRMRLRCRSHAACKASLCRRDLRVLPTPSCGPPCSVASFKIRTATNASCGEGLLKKEASLAPDTRDETTSASASSVRTPLQSEWDRSSCLVAGTAAPPAAAGASPRAALGKKNVAKIPADAATAGCQRRCWDGGGEAAGTGAGGAGRARFLADLIQGVGARGGPPRSRPRMCPGLALAQSAAADRRACGYWRSQFAGEIGVVHGRDLSGVTSRPRCVRVAMNGRSDGSC
eukprot:366105-Chlamydomonas_euryale.AAC.2